MGLVGRNFSSGMNGDFLRKFEPWIKVTSCLNGPESVQCL